MEEDKLELASLLITLGTDIKLKFAWCLREVNGEQCVCLHERNDGFSKFSETDFITAMPLKNILRTAKMRNLDA